jgi:hypothetical protein
VSSTRTGRHRARVAYRRRRRRGAAGCSRHGAKARGYNLAQVAAVLGQVANRHRCSRKIATTCVSVAAVRVSRAAAACEGVAPTYPAMIQHQSQGRCPPAACSCRRGHGTPATLSPHRIRPLCSEPRHQHSRASRAGRAGSAVSRPQASLRGITTRPGTQAAGLRRRLAATATHKHKRSNTRARHKAGRGHTAARRWGQAEPTTEFVHEPVCGSSVLDHGVAVGRPCRGQRRGGGVRRWRRRVGHGGA